jgi:hypothetical protein
MTVGTSVVPSTSALYAAPCSSFTPGNACNSAPSLETTRSTVMPLISIFFCVPLATSMSTSVLPSAACTSMVMTIILLCYNVIMPDAAVPHLSVFG